MFLTITIRITIHAIVQTCVDRLLDSSWRQSPSWDLERYLLAQLLIWAGQHIFCNVALVFKRVSFQVYIIFSSSCYNNKLMIFSQYNSWVNDEVGFIYVAEDWLNPDAVLEAFEARALRMAVTCAKNLSKFENQEQGTLLTPWIQNNWLPCQLISQTTHKFFLSAGFQELLADLVEAAIAHCQLIVVSK